MGPCTYKLSDGKHWPSSHLTHVPDVAVTPTDQRTHVADAAVMLTDQPRTRAAEDYAAERDKLKDYDT